MRVKPLRHLYEKWHINTLPLYFLQIDEILKLENEINIISVMYSLSNPIVLLTIVVHYVNIFFYYVNKIILSCSDCDIDIKVDFIIYTKLYN